MYRLLLILSLSLWNLSAWAFSPKVEKVQSKSMPLWVNWISVALKIKV